MGGLGTKPGCVLKRLIDVTVAVILLLVFAPLLFVIAAAIRIRMGRPVLFRQVRPGFRGLPFELLKFRTMTNDTGPDGALLPDGARLTPLGTFLRATSLDELPELWNVLCGDMSLVGPRPLLMEYLDRYTAQQARRHEVKPGITGWAQVNGRNAVTWEQRFLLDLWYVENRRVSLDVRILLMTIWRVLRGTGVAQRGHATMPRFTGTRPRTEDGDAR